MCVRWDVILASTELKQRDEMMKDGGDLFILMMFQIKFNGAQKQTGN